MALAIHFDRLIRQRAVGSYSEIARLTGTSPAWITEIMKLADLPVPEQEELLSCRHPFSPRPAGRLWPLVTKLDIHYPEVGIGVTV